MIYFLKKFQVHFLALTIWAAYFCLYLITVPASLPEGDEGILLGVAHRIAKHGFAKLPQNITELAELREYSFYGFFKSGFPQINFWPEWSIRIIPPSFL